MRAGAIGTALALALALGAAAASGQAPPPANAQIQAVEADLDRLEQQAAGAGNAAGANRILRLLSLTEGRLKGAPDQGHPSWQAAAERLSALQQRLQAVASGRPPAAPPPAAAGAPQAAPPAAAAAPAATPVPAADPNVERALRELGFAARTLAGMRGADVRTEQRLLADLQRIGAFLQQIADKSQPRWQEAEAERQRQLAQLARLRVEAIRQQTAEAAERIAALAPLALLGDGAAPLARDLARLGDELAVYDAYRADAALAPAWTEHAGAGALLERRLAEARAQEGALGDVAAEVAAIDRRLREMPVPPALADFDSKPAVLAYAEAIRAAHAQTVRDGEYLKAIDGKTDKVDRNTWQRLAYWVGQQRPQEIDRSLAGTRAALESRWTDFQAALDFRAADDPADPHHQANRFLGEGQYEANLGQLRRGLAFVEVASAYEAAVAIPNAETRQRQKAALEAALAAYETDYLAALAAVRMQPGVDDPALAEIAAATLRQPGYAVHLPWQRLVVGAKARRKEARTVASGGALVTNLYEWEEFQARTAERVDGRWYVFVNDLRFFHSGDATTPLGRWLVAKRWQSVRILEENIGK